MLNKTRKFNNIVVALYFMLIISMLVLPIVKYSVKYLYIIAASLPLMLLYATQRRKNLSVLYLTLGALGLFFIFSFLMNTPLSVSESINFSLITYICFLPYFMFEYETSKNSQFEMKLILALAFLMFMFIMVRTFLEFSVDPIIARRMAMGTNDNEYVNELRSKNLGGFGFSYAVGMIIPYFADKIMNTKGKKRAIFIVLFVSTLVYSIFTQYTTLLILSIIFSIIVFIIDSKGTVTKVLLGTFALLLLFFLTKIIGFLANHIPLQELAYHFKLLYVSLTTGEQTTSRLLYMRRCFGLFRSHPFFGIDMLDSYHAYVVNHGHSTYIPMLASHGLIGTSLYIGLTILIMKGILAKFQERKALIIVFALYFVLGIVNPNNVFEISVMTFFIIPLLEYYSQKTREEEEYE